MMNFRLYFALLMYCHIFWSCHQSITEPPSPTDSNVVVYHGDIYIACDNGPLYRFTLDSLIANCSAEDTFNLSFPTGIQTNTATCTYDGNPVLATSDTDYDFAISRNDIQTTFTHPNIDVTLLPYLIIDTDTIFTNEHPFYSAYQADWENNILNLYIYNAYIGGCLHDMIIWRLEREE